MVVDVYQDAYQIMRQKMRDALKRWLSGGKPDFDDGWLGGDPVLSDIFKEVTNSANGKSAD